MKRLVATFLFVMCCACSKPEQPPMPGNSTTIPAEGFVHRDGQSIHDPAGAPLSLRCVNVDSWLLPIPYLVSDSGNALLTSPSEFAGRMDELVGAEQAASFWKDWRDRFITEGDFQRMAGLGFNCARVVLYHRAITTDSGALDDEVLGYVDRALDWGRRHDVYLVLDLHSAPGGQNGVATVSDVPSDDLRAQLWEGEDAAANKDATVAIWSALAERYRDSTVVAGYDLLNEPALPAGVDAAELPALMTRLGDAVREVDPDHMLFVEGDKLAHDFSAFTTPIDDNMAYAFHAYALTGFEDWNSPSTQALQPYLSLRDDHDRPIWLGEWGENTKEWQTSMVTLMEQNNVGWAVYPWKRKQTWFFNPVLQRIPDSPKWYVVASYLAQPHDGTVEKPDEQAVEAGMQEILSAIQLENCIEDRELSTSLIR